MVPYFNQIGLTFLLWFLFLLPSHSQDSKSFLSLNLYPNYGLVFSSYPGPNDQSSTLAYRSKLSLSGQLVYGLKFKNWFSGSIGIGYQNYGFKRVRVKGRYYILTDDYADIKLFYNYHNLEIPFQGKAYFSKRVYGLLGLNPSFNLTKRERTEIVHVDGREELLSEKDKSSPARFTNLFVRVGIGFELVKKENYSFFIEPAIQTSAFMLNKTTGQNYRLVAIGISTGVSFSK